MTLLDDYAGPFEPEWSLERLSRRALARLARERMLLSMIHNQSFIPHLMVLGGREETIAVAEAEWMGASPIYTARNRANHGISGSSVADVFKSFQFDIGVPHHFLDFRFRVDDDTCGEFWLAYCGAYHHVRLASADDAGTIYDMCHHMEDRTFDATLAVVNPGARVHAVHRPPTPAQGPDGAHCRWEVRIEPDGAPPEDHPMLSLMRRTKAAQHRFPLGESLEAGGMDDYTGEFDGDLRLEDLSHAALVRQVKEFTLDVHLLMRGGYAYVDENHGSHILDDLAVQDRAAMMPMAVRRLRDALRIDGDGVDAIAKLLQVHPFVPDGYLRLGVAVDDGSSGRVWVSECEGLDDDQVSRSPLSWLHEPDSPPFDSLVRTVNPQAVMTPLDARDVPEADARVAWRFRIDPDAVAPELPWTTGMIGLNDMAGFDLTERPVPVRLHGRATTDGR